MAMIWYKLSITRPWTVSNTYLVKQQKNNEYASLSFAFIVRKEMSVFLLLSVYKRCCNRKKEDYKNTKIRINSLVFYTLIKLPIHVHAHLNTQKQLEKERCLFL